MKEMKIKILPDGEVKISDIKGVKGKGCLLFTEALEKELGQVTEREFTEEYYKEESYNTEKIEEKQF